MDNSAHLHLKTDSNGISAYWFNLSTDNYALYLKTFDAIQRHGSVISRIVGGLDSAYHRSIGYRDYMIWAILPDSADVNSFLIEAREEYTKLVDTQTLTDSEGRCIGVIATTDLNWLAE